MTVSCASSIAGFDTKPGHERRETLKSSRIASGLSSLLRLFVASLF